MDAGHPRGRRKYYRLRGTDIEPIAVRGPSTQNLYQPVWQACGCSCECCGNTETMTLEALVRESCTACSIPQQISNRGQADRTGKQIKAQVGAEHLRNNRAWP